MIIFPYMGNYYCSIYWAGNVIIPTDFHIFRRVDTTNQRALGWTGFSVPPLFFGGEIFDLNMSLLEVRYISVLSCSIYVCLIVGRCEHGDIDQPLFKMF